MPFGAISTIIVVLESGEDGWVACATPLTALISSVIKYVCWGMEVLRTLGFQGLAAGYIIGGVGMCNAVKFNPLTTRSMYAYHL